MRARQTLARLAGQSCAALLIVVASLVLHLGNRNGRRAVRDLVLHLASPVVPGRVTLREVRAFGPDRIELRGLSWHDMVNAPMLEEAQVVVTPAWRLLPALLHRGPFPRIEVRARRVWARRPGMPQPVASTGPAGPPPPPLDLDLPQIEIKVAEVVDALDDGPAFVVRDLEGGGAFAIHRGEPEFVVRALRASVGIAGLAPMHLDLRARARGPRDLDGDLSLRGSPISCAVRLRSEAGDLGVTSHGCELGAAFVSTLAARPLPPLRIAQLDARWLGDESLQLEARVLVNGEDFALNLRSQRGAIVGSVEAREARLAWWAGETSPWRINGTLRANLARRAGGWGLAVDATEVRATVQGFTLPGVVADAQITGSRLELRAVRAPALGLEARGSIDLARGLPSLDLEARADALPLQRLAPEHVVLGGVGRLQASAHGEAETLRVSLRGNVTEPRGGGVRARSVDLAATGTIAQGRNEIDAIVTLSGLRFEGFGPIDARVRVEGDPLASLRLGVQGATAVPPGVRASLHTTGIQVIRIDAEGTLVRDAAATRLRIARADLRAGPLALGARGAVTLATPASGARFDNLDLRLATPGGGFANLRASGDRADLELREVSLRALAPVLPVLASVGGVLRGEAHLDLARPERSRGRLSLADLQAPYFGRMSPIIDLQPARAGLSELRLSWNAAGAPTSDAQIVLRLPRRLDDTRGWFAGLQQGEIPLPPIAATAFEEHLGRGLRLRGTLTPHLSFSRRAETRRLEVQARLDGEDLVFGIGLLGLRRDLIEALRLRAAICAEVDVTRGFDNPFRARLALGRADANEAVPTIAACDRETRLLPSPLVDLAASLDGPWRDAIASILALDLATLRTPPEALLPHLATVPIGLRLRVGPIVRAQWPLRAVRLPGMPEALRDLLAPPVPPETRLGAELEVVGTAAAPRARLSVDASSPQFTPIGLDAPVDLTALATLNATGQRLVDPLAMDLEVRGAVSPQAASTERGSIDARARVSGRLAELTRGSAALHLDGLSVDAQNLRVERVAELAARHARGALDVQVQHTGDPTEPFDLVMTFRDFHAMPPGLEREAAAIPPVGARLHARMQQRGVAASLVGCLSAGAGPPPPACTPRPVDLPARVGERELRVDGELPFPSGILGPPDIANFALAIRAMDFQLDGLSALVPTGIVEDLGGRLGGEAIWSNQRPARPSGTLGLHAGRGTFTALGEPLERVEAALELRGDRIEIRQLEGRIGAGTFSVRGDALLGGHDELARVTLEARTREFPAVANGHTWAWVTGTLGLQAGLRTSGVDLDVRVHEAQVRVQDEPPRELIALAPDPAVFVLGRSQLTRTEVADTTPINLRWTVETPIWLRRSDFVIAVTGSGSAHLDRAGNAIAARIEAVPAPSWVSFYGKRFELEQVSLTLDGSVVVNPVLELRARHETAQSGPVVLSLRGRLDDPEVRLVAERFPEMGMAEVLQLLLLGRRDGGPTTGQTDLASQAVSAAQSLVTGLTLGFVTSTLRSEISWLPTLIVEPGAANAGRYGAGFNPGPRWYLQATYGAAASSAVGLASAGAAGAGQEIRVLLEYAISTALTASASFAAPPQGSAGNQLRYGADLYWSP